MALQTWRGDFDPKKLQASQWFTHYLVHFDIFEVNNSFEGKSFLDYTNLFRASQTSVARRQLMRYK